MRRFAGPVPFGSTLVVVILLLGGYAVAVDGHQDHQPPILDEILVEGSTVFDQQGVQDRLRLELGEPIPEDLTRLNRRLERVYHRRGYAYAKVEARFDDTTGLLTIHVDEGRFDEIEFRGVDRDLALTLAARGESLELDRSPESISVPILGVWRWVRNGSATVNGPCGSRRRISRRAPGTPSMRG